VKPASDDALADGPPRRRRLTRAEIERAALAIVDAEGLPALTMRRLGAELGVEGMAIYHHVPSKSVLLDRVVTRVVDEVRFEPGPGGPWRSMLAGFGGAYRSALLAHPRAMSLVATRPVDPETGLRLVTPVLERLRDAGFDDDRALLAIQSVGAFTIGHVLAQTGGGEPAPEEGDTMPRGDDDYYDRWYELGLGALVAGIAPAN
jgi:TetR/AcrR family tetracycline transcriptional repressor